MDLPDIKEFNDLNNKLNDLIAISEQGVSDEELIEKWKPLFNVYSKLCFYLHENCHITSDVVNEFVKKISDFTFENNNKLFTNDLKRRMFIIFNRYGYMPGDPTGTEFATFDSLPEYLSQDQDYF